jgi:hypothetical protein
MGAARPADGQPHWGSAVLRVGGPVPRWAAIRHHPDDQDANLNTLRRIHAVRGVRPSELGPKLNLDVYAEVLEPERYRSLTGSAQSARASLGYRVVVIRGEVVQGY